MNLPKKNYFAPMHTAEHILNKTMFNCQRSENCHIEKKNQNVTLSSVQNQLKIR